MSNINWKVESCEVHTPSPYTLPAIEVSLIGTVDGHFPYTSATIGDLVRDIETKLNPKVESGRIQAHSIKNVIFNDPATIVFWGDGTKTVVKCGGDDIFDPEKGLTMAISKKFLGNQGNYYNEIKKWVGADLYMNEKLNRLEGRK